MRERESFLEKLWFVNRRFMVEPIRQGLGPRCPAPRCCSPFWPGNPSEPSGVSGKVLASLPSPPPRLQHCLSGYQESQTPTAAAPHSAHCPERETEARSGAVICSWVTQKVAAVTRPHSLTDSLLGGPGTQVWGRGEEGNRAGLGEPQLVWSRLGLGETPRRAGQAA